MVILFFRKACIMAFCLLYSMLRTMASILHLLYHFIYSCCHFQGAIDLSPQYPSVHQHYSVLLLIVYLSPTSDLPKCITSHSLRLNSICSFSAHFCIRSISCCILGQPSSLTATPGNLESRKKCLEYIQKGLEITTA